MSASITSNPSFNATTAAEEVAAALASSIAGKTVLITGVTPGGLGAYFAKVVAAHQPKLLILAGRTVAKIAETAAGIQAAHPDVATRSLELDLSSQAQVRKAAAEVLSWSEPIDVLVNNAAVMATPYGKTADGLELQFGTNHIGHFLFTNLIMPKLLESTKGPRVINISSAGHRFSDIRWDDIGFQVSCLICLSRSIAEYKHAYQDGKAYHKWRAYGQSKTANILFSVELAQRLGSKGLKSFSVHPGGIATNLGRYMADIVKDITELSEYPKHSTGILARY